MKKSFIRFFLFILIFSLVSCGARHKSLPLEKVSALSENHFECFYDGIKHDFIVDLPPEPEGAPLVVMLPGWGNLAATLRFSTHFSEFANPRGYAVVYVTGARNKYERTGVISWNSGIAAKGNDDVGFLIALTNHLQTKYNLARAQAYAVGFSNGAFMSHRLAMEAGQTFSACVSVAGFMPEEIWKNKNKKNHMSFFQVTGEFDDVIPKHGDGTAAFTENPAIEDVMEYWAFSNGLFAREESPVGDKSILTKFFYADEDRPAGPENSGNLEFTEKASENSKNSKTSPHQTSPQVWHLLIKDGRHSWPEKQFCGLEVNSLILDFLDQC